MLDNRVTSNVDPKATTYPEGSKFKTGGLVRKNENVFFAQISLRLCHVKKKKTDLSYFSLVM